MIFKGIVKVQAPRNPYDTFMYYAEGCLHLTYQQPTDELRKALKDWPKGYFHGEYDSDKNIWKTFHQVEDQDW